MRADRNLYSKTLIEAQDEINELKRKVATIGAGFAKGVGGNLNRLPPSDVLQLAAAESMLPAKSPEPQFRHFQVQPPQPLRPTNTLFQKPPPNSPRSCRIKWSSSRRRLA